MCKKMTVVRKTFVMLLVSCVFLAGCSKSKGELALQEVEKLKAENEEIKRTVEEMKEVEEDQNKLEQVKNLEGYSKDDLERLQGLFEKLILNPSYEPEESNIMPLFYYISGNTDVVKKIYDDGNPILAEAIVEKHMYWGGQFKKITPFIKTWASATDDEDSEWNNMLYGECVKAFETFKYYPEDLETAKVLLPSNFFSEIMKHHEEREKFPDGITKEDYK